MATWNSRGLRGSTLEELINYSNTRYRDSGIALVQKIPTPIKPMTIDKSNGHITLAFFEQKSTVDYVGVIQGIPVCFDAKECSSKTFPMKNIHQHQIQFMTEFEQQGGVAFIILYYSTLNELYYIPFKDIQCFNERALSNRRKSFTYDELDKSYQITDSNGVPVHYLPALQLDLDARELKDEGIL